MTSSADLPNDLPNDLPAEPVDEFAGLANQIPEEAAAVVRAWRAENDLDYDEKVPGQLSFALPGEKKLQTPVRLDLGPHALGIHAFVCRNPDENHVGVYRWLLEKNLRLYAVAFAVDKDGDIYLDARLPLGSVTTDDLDRILGTVLTVADNSFNTLLELGFATSIRKEWEWRLSHGEPTKNLEAFEHLRPEA